MSDIRVAKGWTHFGSNNLNIYNAPSSVERGKKDKKANNILKNIKKNSVDELLDEALKAADAKQKAKEKYEQAVRDGKVQPPKKKRPYRGKRKVNKAS